MGRSHGAARWLPHHRAPLLPQSRGKATSDTTDVILVGLTAPVCADGRALRQHDAAEISQTGALPLTVLLIDHHERVEIAACTKVPLPLPSAELRTITLDLEHVDRRL
jgi:hypothetical protein